MHAWRVGLQVHLSRVNAGILQMQRDVWRAADLATTTNLGQCTAPCKHCSQRMSS
jgi:hypothetical protein